MKSPLSSESFELLLERLGSNRDEAALGYELLRIKLTKFFLLRGCADAAADALADESINRIAERIKRDGDKIRVQEFSIGVARYVWLEHQRLQKETPYGLDAPEVAASSNADPEEDDRTHCLRTCIRRSALSDVDIRILVGYYDNENEQLKSHRKRMGDELGLSPVNLRVKAHRLRTQIERCIKSCLQGFKDETIRAKSDIKE